MQRDYSPSEKTKNNNIANVSINASVFTGKHRLKYLNNDRSAMAFGMTQAQVKGGDHVMQVQGHCSKISNTWIANQVRKSMNIQKRKEKKVNSIMCN